MIRWRADGGPCPAPAGSASTSPQPVTVAQVLVLQGDSDHALTNQRLNLMFDKTRAAIIGEAGANRSMKQFCTVTILMDDDSVSLANARGILSEQREDWLMIFAFS